MNVNINELWEAYDLQVESINRQLKPHQTISNIGQGGKSEHVILDSLQYVYYDGQMYCHIESGLDELDRIYNQILKAN